MGAFLYLRICQGEVSKAQEFQATLSYTASKTLPLKTTKNKKKQNKKTTKPSNIQLFTLYKELNSQTFISNNYYQCQIQVEVLSKMQRQL